MNLFTLLNANNYFTVNREIARKIGLEATIFLSEIIDKFTYFESKNMLEDGWFYLTMEDVLERTTLSRRYQDTAIKILTSLGFIEMKRMGMPAKRYFKVFKEKITDWLNCTNKIGGCAKQECTETPNKNGESVQTAHIEIKKPKEEPYKKREGDTPSSVCLFQREHVSFPKETYDRLCEKYGEALVESTIVQLNLYANIKPKEFKKYEKHGAVIESWILKNATQTEKEKWNKTSHRKSINSSQDSAGKDMQEQPFTTFGSILNMDKKS